MQSELALLIEVFQPKIAKKIVFEGVKLIFNPKPS
jgi:hypothetical protein